MRVSEESEESEAFCKVLALPYICAWFLKKLHKGSQVSQSFTYFTNCQKIYDEWRPDAKLLFDI